MEAALCLCAAEARIGGSTLAVSLPFLLPSHLSLLPPALPFLPTHPLPLQLALLIKDKGSLSEESMPALQEIVGEEDKAREIVEVRLCC